MKILTFPYVPSFLFVILFILVIVIFILSVRRPKNYPPGPSWLPIMGNLRDIKKLSIELGGHHLAFTHMAQKFKTNVLGLKLGGDLTVVVSSYETVKHVLVNEEYVGRPNNFFIRLRCMGARRGITCIDGSYWVEQRGFVVSHLRSMGYGKKHMKDMVFDEVDDILKTLEELCNNDESIQFGVFFAPSVLNVLWTLAADVRFERTDARLITFLQLLHKRTKAFDMAGGTMSQLPWLRHIIPEQIGYNMLVKLNKQLKCFFMEIINEHYETWYPDRDDDLMYAYISKIKSSINNENFNDDQLVIIFLDLFLAGAITTSSTLDFIFLEMLLHPDIQEKAAKYLRTNTNLNEPLKYDDRFKVPYVEAIILEAERFHGVTPIIGPRRVLENTTLEGYNIEKETTVLINIYSVHFDKKYWGDPHVFRPERFLDEHGKLTGFDRVLNFGLGKRRCLGELLARQCIFMFFGAILRKYKIVPVPGTEPLSNIDVPGLTLSPKPYKAKLIPRINE